MLLYNQDEIRGLAVKQVGKPAVWVDVRLDLDSPEDEKIWEFIESEVKAIYGETDKFHDIIIAMCTHKMIFFDTKEEQYRFYYIFEQPLINSSVVYACAYNSDGQCETENT